MIADQSPEGHLTNFMFLITLICCKLKKLLNWPPVIIHSSCHFVKLHKFKHNFTFDNETEMADDQNKHKALRSKFCQICGEHTGKVEKNKCSALKFVPRIQKWFCRNVTADTQDVHPTKFRRKCHSSMRNFGKRKNNNFNEN